jgi:putative thiamine transport system substrate-binding protein
MYKYFFSIFFGFTSINAADKIYFNAWAGNEKINQYIQKQSQIFEKKTGIQVVHVKVSEYESVIKKISAEKVAKNISNGSVDVIWANGENFAALKNQGLLYGPITTQDPNYKLVDSKDPNFNFDFNVPVEGYEIPWGKAQFVFIWDKSKTPNPPQTAAQFLEFAKANAGKLTYVKPPQFHGVTFLKQILLDLSPKPDDLKKSCDQVNMPQLAEPLWTYLNELHPVLWRKGGTFPLSVQKMNQMLLDQEILLSMSFNPLESDALVKKKEIPKDSVSMTFKKGGIGNVHFLSIPFNSKNKPAARQWIDHLLSVDAQAEKSNIDIWGDPTVLDIKKLSAADQNRFPAQVLKGPLLSEPHACWVKYIQDEWLKRYGVGLKN